MIVCRDDPARKLEFENARSLLVSEHSETIFKRAKKLCLSWPTFEPTEVFNDLVVRLYRKLDKFNPNRGSLADYVAGTAWTSFVDYCRQDKPRSDTLSMQGAVGCDGKSTTIEDLLADTDYISPVDLVMDVEKILKPQEHTVILGYYFDRKTLDDIAKEISCTTQYVSTLKLKAEIKHKDYYQEKSGSVSAKCA